MITLLAWICIGALAMPVIGLDKILNSKDKGDKHFGVIQLIIGLIICSFLFN